MCNVAEQGDQCAWTVVESLQHACYIITLLLAANNHRLAFLPVITSYVVVFSLIIQWCLACDYVYIVKSAAGWCDSNSLAVLLILAVGCTALAASTAGTPSLRADAERVLSAAVNGSWVACSSQCRGRCYSVSGENVVCETTRCSYESVCSHHTGHT